MQRPRELQRQRLPAKRSKRGLLLLQGAMRSKLLTLQADLDQAMDTDNWHRTESLMRQIDRLENQLNG